MIIGIVIGLFVGVLIGMAIVLACIARNRNQNSGVPDCPQNIPIPRIKPPSPWSRNDSEDGIFVSAELLEMPVMMDPDMSNLEPGTPLREVIEDLKQQCIAEQDNESS